MAGGARLRWAVGGGQLAVVSRGWGSEKKPLRAAVLWRSGRPAEDAAQTKVGSGHGSAHREAGLRAAGTKHCEFRRPASLVAAEQAASKKIPIIVTGILADYIIVTGIIIDLTNSIIIAVRRSRRQPPLGWRVAKAGNLQDPAGGTCTRTSTHGPG